MCREKAERHNSFPEDISTHVPESSNLGGGPASIPFQPCFNHISMATNGNARTPLAAPFTAPLAPSPRPNSGTKQTAAPGCSANPPSPQTQPTTAAWGCPRSAGSRRPGGATGCSPRYNPRTVSSRGRRQHAAHLGQRVWGVRDAAQRVGAHDRIEAGVRHYMLTNRSVRDLGDSLKRDAHYARATHPRNAKAV